MRFRPSTGGKALSARGVAPSAVGVACTETPGGAGEHLVLRGLEAAEAGEVALEDAALRGRGDLGGGRAGAAEHGSGVVGRQLGGRRLLLEHRARERLDPFADGVVVGPGEGGDLDEVVAVAAASTRARSSSGSTPVSAATVAVVAAGSGGPAGTDPDGHGALLVLEDLARAVDDLAPLGRARG